MTASTPDQAVPEARNYQALLTLWSSFLRLTAVVWRANSARLKHSTARRRGLYCNGGANYMHTQRQIQRHRQTNTHLDTQTQIHMHLQKNGTGVQWDIVREDWLIVADTERERHKAAAADDDATFSLHYWYCCV